ncbi:MAG TPA: hypothetical protein VKD72_40060, partial [Gemmataceae bacterium]|nr:hypothetical protein [Gemmataceae bacterium]
RSWVYSLLTVVAVAAVVARICNAELVYEPSLHRNPEDQFPPAPQRVWPARRPAPMPTFSSNDRSRWATVRALVENGTYVIGHRDPAKATAKNKYGDEGIVFEDGWQTVDKVMNPETHDFYSSKPPLLPTLMAGEYWLLKHAFGWSFATHRWAVVRTIVLTFNWLPWLLYLWLLSRLVEQLGATDWGRLYVFATGCFGTLLTPFLVSINNHTLATCSALLAVYFAAQVFLSESPRWWSFAMAGFFAAFTATDELPAASFTAALGLLLLWRFPRQTLCFFAPAALVPVAAFLLTNYLAIGELVPAYSKRDTDWYRYEGSHWGKDPDPVKPGIDFARLKEDRLTYAVHVLVGHHGLFSLTPVFVLAVVGMLWGAWRLKASGGRPSPLSPLGRGEKKGAHALRSPG